MSAFLKVFCWFDPFFFPFPYRQPVITDSYKMGVLVKNGERTPACT